MTTTSTHRAHREATSEVFQRNPALAADYLTDVLANGDDVDIMLALRSIRAAFGSVQEVSRQPDANPDALRADD